MLIAEGLPFITDYIAALNDTLKTQKLGCTLTRLQTYWLSFVILGLLLTNTVCWRKMERFGTGRYSSPGLSWMFRRAKIAWSLLLQASVMRILDHYGIQTGSLIIDDTDRERSKNTTQIAKVHTIRDKKRAGYFKGQNVVFLVLVSNELTLPVGFEFYETNPDIAAWYREEARLKEKGVAKKHRPSKPEESADYPSKKRLGVCLLKSFASTFPHFNIKSISADCFYCSQDFIEQAETATGCSQIISQIKKIN